MTRDKLKLTGIFALFLLFGSALALLIYFAQVFNRTEFLPGVEIAGISVRGYNQEQACDAVQKLVDQADNTEILFYKDDYLYHTKLSNLREAVDVQQLVGAIRKQEQHRHWMGKFLNLDGSKKIAYPLNISYSQAAIDQMVGEWKKHLAVECQNARLEIDRQKGLVVVPSRIGKTIDKSLTISKLPQRWQDVRQTIKIPIMVKDQRPLVNEEELNNMGQLSEFSTWYKTAEVDRSYNLSKAAAAINASVVAPGGVFSFNRTVGQRLAEYGYRDAMVIVNGKFEPGLGGGVCQVSSTLYNACLLAGLSIAERHNHALSVSYVPLGQDATVSYGTQDFRFKNNTGYPLYIRSIAAAGKLTTNIYGHLAFKQRIKITNVVDQVIDFQTIQQVDETLPPGTEKVENKGMPGYVVRSFRTFYDINGNVIRKEQLARDTYKPLNKLVSVGPQVVEPPAEPPDVTEPVTEPEGTVPEDTNQPLPQDTSTDTTL